MQVARAAPTTAPWPGRRWAQGPAQGQTEALSGYQRRVSGCPYPNSRHATGIEIVTYRLIDTQGSFVRQRHSVSLFVVAGVL